MNWLRNYFSLREWRAGGLLEDADGQPAPPRGPRGSEVLLAYLSLAAGVYFQTALTSFVKSGRWDWAETPWGRILPSLLVAFVVFPAVYGGSFDPTKPRFIRLSVIFTSGLGWQSLWGTAAKLAAGSPTY